MKRVLVIVLLVGFALPAQAHSEGDVEEWLQSHERLRERFEATMVMEDPLTIPAITMLREFAAKKADMIRRHPCSEALGTWTDEACLVPDPPPTRSGGSSGGSASSGGSGMGSGVEGWRSLVTAYFAPDQVERALCIMSHESGGNPGAKNPRSTAAGLFQFLKSTWDSMVPGSITGGSYSSGRVFDPAANVAAAAWLSSNVGWSQWAPYQRGLCH